MRNASSDRKIMELTGVSLCSGSELPRSRFEQSAGHKVLNVLRPSLLEDSRKVSRNFLGKLPSADAAWKKQSRAF